MVKKLLDTSSMQIWWSSMVIWGLEAGQGSEVNVEEKQGR